MSEELDARKAAKRIVAADDALRNARPGVDYRECAVIWRLTCTEGGTLVARALLSSRQSILEEAAKVAEALAAELSRLNGLGDRRVQIGSHLETCATIAAAIRSLAHKEKGDE